MAFTNFVKFIFNSNLSTDISLKGGSLRQYGRYHKYGKPFQEKTSIVMSNITPELRYFRDGFRRQAYNNIDSPYGPPLAIVLPWLSAKRMDLRKIINVYLKSGFDVLCVEMSKDQFLYPGKKKHGVFVVSDLLNFLHSHQRYRPYIVHGFSVGCYIFGEMMAQISRNRTKFSPVIYNIKSCLWDSPVDYLHAAPILGKVMHPSNLFLRFYCDRCVKRHFKKHDADSLQFWDISMKHFASPLSKGPYIFFVSESDPLSNPNSIKATKAVLEENGITTLEKRWLKSGHVQHFQNYEEEYIYGMNLIFYLSNLRQDDHGKYKSLDPPMPMEHIILRKRVSRE